MERIGNRKYRIFRNDELMGIANSIICKPLPSDYSEKADSLAETSDILDKIIKDRSDKIDECVNDALSKVNCEYFIGELCKVVLDDETEKIIEQLFNREEQIFKIKPTADLTIVRFIKNSFIRLISSLNKSSINQDKTTI